MAASSARSKRAVTSALCKDRDSKGDYAALARISSPAAASGFAAVGIARAEVGAAGKRLREWLAAGCHGTMDYMARHADLRCDPAAFPGTVTLISAALDYPRMQPDPFATADPERAYVSRPSGAIIKTCSQRRPSGTWDPRLTGHFPISPGDGGRL